MGSSGAVWHHGWLWIYPVIQYLVSKKKNFFQHDGVHMHLSVSLYSLNDDVLLFVLRFLLCIFLAVQDSSIGDLVNQSVSQ